MTIAETDPTSLDKLFCIWYNKSVGKAKEMGTTSKLEYKIENTKTRKPIGEVRSSGRFLSSCVLSQLPPGSLGIIDGDGSSGENCWPCPLLQSLSCCCAGTSRSGFHAAETAFPEMTTDPEMIQIF